MGGSEETTIGEILGLAVALFSLAGEQCVQNDVEMTAWRVSWCPGPFSGFLIRILPGQSRLDTLIFY